MSQTTVLLVSIDGVAPRFVGPQAMPNLCSLARTGASCFSGRTVTPSLTLPAHTSMLRGVEPASHGVLGNTPTTPKGGAPTVLAHARGQGLTTFAAMTWLPLESIIEPDAVDAKLVVDQRSDTAADARVTLAAQRIMGERNAELLFVYLGAPDLVGHSCGWGSPAYLEALADADARLGTLAAAAGSEYAVCVTTDHGGLGTEHHRGRSEDLETFLAIRSPLVTTGSTWPSFSICDVAPTVAALTGLDPHPDWTGRSLLGSEEALADVLMALLLASDEVNYGENVTMLQHALQTAAVARQQGASEDLVLAALLHDVGHLVGEAGQWGLPTHAEVAARWLRPLLPAAIVEPIGLHVLAKQHLVATDPEYAQQLSEASTVSLEQQGGALDAEQQAEFLARPYADSALQLRRWDDAGKISGIDVNGLESYEAALGAVIGRSDTSDDAAWLRDACRCAECRDAGNGQHLIDVADLAGWHVVGQQTFTDRIEAELVHVAGQRHRCVVPLGLSVAHRPRHLWGAEFGRQLTSGVIEADGSRAVEEACAGLERHGLVLLSGVPTTPGEVLSVAARLGHVRHTNYGDLFDVVTEPDPTNLAYTPLGLPLHTDNPYRDPCPTVQLLHCLESAGDGGGRNQFSDGFRAAEVLRSEDPAHFDVLSSTLACFRFAGDGVDLRAWRPLIEVDPAGKVVAISVNHRSMEPPEPGPAAGRFYAAYLRFRDVLASAEAVAELQLKAGNLIAFDNRRVLHGRSAFAAGSRRHLQGCYIDMDAIRSTSHVARALASQAP